MWETLYQYFLTPLFIFVAGFIYLRIGGKKAVSEMNSVDLLLVIVLGTIISEPLVTQHVGRALLYAGIFLIIYILFSHASLNNKLRWLLVASPTVLIRNGDIDEKGLKKTKMTVTELISELRTKGYTKSSDVELAVLEGTGEFSVIPKSEARPLQPSDINISPSPAFIPIPVIMDGQIIDHNIKYLQKDREWLELQLHAKGIAMEQLNKVTLATVNQTGTLDIDTNNTHDNDHGPDSYKPGRKN